MKKDGYYILKTEYAHSFTEIICIDHLGGDKYCREHFDSPYIDQETKEKHISTGWISLDGGCKESDTWMRKAYHYTSALPMTLREAIESRSSLCI